MSKQSNATVWSCDNESGFGRCTMTKVTQGDMPAGWLHIHWRSKTEPEVHQLYYCSAICARSHLRDDLKAPGVAAA